jgi:hypothetical protein
VASFVTEQALIRHLTRSFASAFSHRKSGYASDAVPRFLQGIERLAQSESERANHARCHHRNTGSAIFSIRNPRLRHF